MKDKSTRELHLARKKMWDASMANHVRYLDRASGQFNEKFVERRSCPACGSGRERLLFHKSGGTYVACMDCEMVYLNPVFTDKYLEEYYRQNHDVQAEIVESDSEFYTRLYRQGMDSIVEVTGNRGSILDVGCSAGGFLDVAQGYGWSTFGIELNQREAAHARRKGHQVYEELLANAAFPRAMEAIALWDVFEHIKDGLQFLLDAKRVLSGRGTVFLQSPTPDSLAAKVLQEKCNVFDGLEHVNLYGRHNLLEVAGKAGYEVVKYETVISEVGVINNYLHYEDPYLGGVRDNKNVLGLLGEEWIFEHQLGYKYQACLRLKS
jgi:SAM-dependent methyltransferase